MFRLEDYAIPDNFRDPYEHCNIIIEPTESLGGICVGNLKASQDPAFLKAFNIDVVLDVAGVAYQYPDQMIRHCKVVVADDHVEFDLSVFFDDCFDYIQEHRKKGCNVLVHCHAGISRSATIVIGYLMKYENMNLKTSLAFVLKKRPCIYPNSGFMKQLFDYETRLKQVLVDQKDKSAGVSECLKK